jgi:hypothetical protein
MKKNFKKIAEICEKFSEGKIPVTGTLYNRRSTGFGARPTWT